MGLAFEDENYQSLPSTDHLVVVVIVSSLTYDLVFQENIFIWRKCSIRDMKDDTEASHKYGNERGT